MVNRSAYSADHKRDDRKRATGHRVPSQRSDQPVHRAGKDYSGVFTLQRHSKKPPVPNPSSGTLNTRRDTVPPSRRLLRHPIRNELPPCLRSPRRFRAREGTSCTVCAFQVSRWRGGRFAWPATRLRFQRKGIAYRSRPAYDDSVLGTSFSAHRKPPSWAVQKYQNTIQNPYGSRPPQTPAAPLKRLYRN